MPNNKNNNYSFNKVEKVIIPAAGLGTRFLPLSKVIPKELFPLVNKPVISYVAKEAVDSNIEEIIFVLNEKKKAILDYFIKNAELENILKKNGNKELLNLLEESQEPFLKIKINSVQQDIPLGDGDAVLKAEKKIEDENFGVMFSDDVFKSKIPVLSQLINIFKTSQRPVIGLKKVEKEKLQHYGVVEAEPIAKKIYKIKKVIEKPKEKAPSDLAIVGRYVFSPEIFYYLKNTKPNEKGEIKIADALSLMIQDGKIIYGYEFEGEWIECGKISDWLISNLYLSLMDEKFGPMLKDFIKKLKI
ncbi:MAG: UTP--glucose-1-phosphate uridylyltransferase [Minisyncoccia bacterium]